LGTLARSLADVGSVLEDERMKGWEWLVQGEQGNCRKGKTENKYRIRK